MNAPVDGRLDEAERRSRVGGRAPPVDGDLTHLGAGGGEGGSDLRRRHAVELDGDAGALQGLGQQVVEELVHLLVGRAPPHLEAGGPDGARRLRPPGDDLRVPEGVEQRIAQSPDLGGLEPGPDADPGRRRQVAGWSLDQGERGGMKGIVGGQVGRFDRRPDDDLGAAAAQQLGLLRGPAVGRDAHHEAFEGTVAHAVQHEPPVCRHCFRTLLAGRTFSERKPVAR